jgi:serine/threonine-protein kinase RsbW
VQSTSTNKLSIQLPSSRQTVTEVADRLAALLDRFDLPEDVVFDIKLAAQEAVVNAVEHGNRNDQTKAVHVTCEVKKDAVAVTVRDEGGGFDPSTVPDPTLPENVLKEHGRGIFLMRNLADDVFYNTGGNEVTVIKKLPAAK